MRTTVAIVAAIFAILAMAEGAARAGGAPVLPVVPHAEPTANGTSTPAARAAPAGAPIPFAYAAPNPPRPASAIAIVPARPAPATVAAITPPRPAGGAAAASGHSASMTPKGMLLYLRDPPSRTMNPINWVVLAWKSRHLLEVDYRGYPYETYHAVFGRSHFGGPKEFEGDRRTPEGDYLIVSKHRSARFRWFMKINYPNEHDRENYARMRADGDLPRGIGAGGSVGIHGTDEPVLNLGDVDWTTGCISVNNADITQLERLLPIGTLVIIKP